MTGLHDNHNHLVANGDALAMVRAAEAAGLAGFAFTEHVFHLEEARASEPLPRHALGRRARGPADRRRAVPRRDRRGRRRGRAGRRGDGRAWSSSTGRTIPRVREVQDAFVAAHAERWDIVLGSVHCLTGDHSIFDPSMPLAAADGLGRLPRAARRRRRARRLRRRHAPGAARRQPARGARATWPGGSTGWPSSPPRATPRSRSTAPTCASTPSSCSCCASRSGAPARRSASARTRIYPRRVGAVLSGIETPARGGRAPRGGVRAPRAGATFRCEPGSRARRSALLTSP